MKLIRKGKRHASEDEVWKAVNAAETEPVGDWCYYETQTAKCLVIVIPGHGPMLWCYEGTGERIKWALSGPEDAPSLYPSLMVNRDKSDQWHGWFKNGQLFEA